MASTHQLITGEALYRRVVLERIARAGEAVLISTANVKAMLGELQNGRFQPVIYLFVTLAKRGVSVPVLPAELPSGAFQSGARQRTLRGHRPNIVAL